MSEPTPSADREEPTPVPSERAPWQPLGYDKIAAADAENSASSGSPDGTTYS
ncbi:hypothetical protein [Sphingomonas parva]|uniref:hypothetical protein n=1 Tax=Sphingomonas parva TaxID=2555898 RepID=UPI001430CD17|nr:hypothetical protein [Sphingomonas parva]